MLTVLQVVPELDAGGVERTTLDIAGAIAAAGGRALVASAGGRLEPDLALAGGTLVRLPLATKNPLRMRANAYALKALARDENVSLIHARSRAPAWSALMAARSLGLPFVTTYHGIYNGRTAPKRFYNGVMARGDIVIANSRYTADHVARMHGVAADRIAVIPRGMDLDRFSPGAVSPARKADLLAAWGLQAGTGPLLLLPGRLTRWKGQADFIRALTVLKARGRLEGVRAVLAGDAQGRDAYVAELKGLIAAGGLTGQVHIVGHVVDMPAALALSAVAVSASIEPEAFGRVATEAQAMGVPVIATDLGAARETVITEPDTARTGWRVPPGDAEAMADALEAALHLSAAERRALTGRALAHARAEYDVKVMCARTLAVYERVTGRAF